MSAECSSSSGCLSGWTFYFEQSSHQSPTSHQIPFNEEEEEDDDLSMLSDASSGPPQFHEGDYEEIDCLYPAAAATAPVAATDGLKKKKKKKNKRISGEQKRDYSAATLIDTATSPHSSDSKISSNDYLRKSFVENGLEFSCCFSNVAHLKESSAFQKQIGYHQSFTSVNPTPERPVSRRAGNKIW